MAWQRGDDDGRYRMNTKAMLCRSLIDICLGTCCILVRSKSEHGMWKTIGKPKEAMKKRHKMCWFGFLEPKNKNHNNQPQIRVGKPFAVVAACWKWASMAIVASKKDRRLSLAFVRVRRGIWLKMSGPPMGKFGLSGEVFECLPVVSSVQSSLFGRDPVFQLVPTQKWHILHKQVRRNPKVATHFWMCHHRFISW